MSVQDFTVKLSLDTSNFSNSMGKLNKSMGLLKSEFKASNSALGKFGSETDKLKNKQNYLTKALQIQEQKVKSLKESYDKQVEATGENSEEAQKLGAKLNSNISYYNNLKNQLEETNEELKKQTSIITKLTTKSEKMVNIGKKFKETGEKISSVGGKLAGTGTAMIGALSGIALGTKETQEQLGTLETNCKLTGYSFDVMKEKMIDNVSIFGDYDSAVEGISDLMASGLNFDKTQQAIEFANDMAVKFKDTLKFEGVADSIQESLQTGELTGQFEEALGRLGISTEELKEKLKSTTSANERFNIIMDATKGKLDGTAQAFREDNKELVEHNKTMAEMKTKLADIGNKILPALTPIVELVGKLADKVSKFAEEHPDMFDKIVKISLALIGVGSAMKLVGGAISGVSSIIGFMANPIGFAVVAIGTMIANVVILYNKCEWFRNMVNKLLDWFKSSIQWVMEKGRGFPAWIEGMWSKVKTSVSNFWTWITSKLSEFWNWITTKFNNGVEWFKGIWEKIKNLVKFGILFVKELFHTAIELIMLPWRTLWENIKNYILPIWENIKTTVGSAINEVKLKIHNILTDIKVKWNEAWTSIKDFCSTIWDKIKTFVQQKIDKVKNIIGDTMEHIKTVWTEKWNSIKTKVSEIGENIKTVVSEKFNALKEKITTPVHNAYNTVASTFENIRSTISSKIESAKESVRNAIDRMKSFFNFSWSLPHLKMPHFSKSGHFSLNPPEVPHFDVQWYKNGGIMTKPTLFGMNGFSPMIGGEAGAEAILPLNTLFTQMRDIIREENEVNRNINVIVNVNNEMDGKEIGKAVTYEVKKNMDRSNRNYSRNLGR